MGGSWVRESGFIREKSAFHNAKTIAILVAATHYCTGFHNSRHLYSQPVSALKSGLEPQIIGNAALQNKPCAAYRRHNKKTPADAGVFAGAGKVVICCPRA
jgi:hypothetical protein